MFGRVTFDGKENTSNYIPFDGHRNDDMQHLAANLSKPGHGSWKNGQNI